MKFLEQLHGVTKLDHEINTDVAKYSEKHKYWQKTENYRNNTEK
jgi:hypothetical protein